MISFTNIYNVLEKNILNKDRLTEINVKLIIYYTKSTSDGYQKVKIHFKFIR